MARPTTSAHVWPAKIFGSVTGQIFLICIKIGRIEVNPLKKLIHIILEMKLDMGLSIYKRAKNLGAWARKMLIDFL